MNEKNLNSNKGTDEKDYTLYTEKIVQSPKVKYKKYLNGLRITGIIAVVVIALVLFVRVVVPWYGANFPKKQEKRDELTIQKDTYSDEESETKTTDKTAGTNLGGNQSTETTTEVDDYETVMGALRSRVTDVQKTVVAVYSHKKNVTELSNEEGTDSDNSGLIVGYVNSEYLIITKSSAISGSDDAIIQFSTGEEIEGIVIGRDEHTDTAMVQISAIDMSYTMLQSVKVAVLDNSYNVHQGDLFLAYGKFYGQNKAVDYGTISEISSRVSVDNTFEIFNTSLAYHTDDYGFIYNMAGNVIGITTTSTGNNMKVIGISDLKSIIEALANKGGSPYFGILGRSVTGTLTEAYDLPYGIYVDEVEVDSPAYDAGLQAGDVICGINGKSVLTIQVFSEKLYQCTNGQTMVIKAMRQGKDGYYDVTFSVTVRIV